ncbi:RNA polymerase sigma factor [Agromyces sp. Root81]|uniref:RNA polymerase sigma factor n=1 Tax=Agromyces sp. Root81 TaxID=1736601 RepID=UPI000AA44D03|nr:RNA polymerase sigma factor [Agromyces sp. Root81]
MIGRDRAVLEWFYRAHLDAVENFVARRVRDPHTAADVTADVFLAAMTTASRYDPDRGSARAWLFGIAYRVIADTQRRAARRWRAAERETNRRTLHDDAITRLEEQLDAASAARELRDSLGQLSRTDRALIELTALDGLSITDAASALNLSAGAARVRLHRAKRKLRQTVECARNTVPATSRGI